MEQSHQIVNAKKWSFVFVFRFYFTHYYPTYIKDFMTLKIISITPTHVLCIQMFNSTTIPAPEVIYEVLVNPNAETTTVDMKTTESRRTIETTLWKSMTMATMQMASLDCWWCRRCYSWLLRRAVNWVVLVSVHQFQVFLDVFQ